MIGYEIEFEGLEEQIAKFLDYPEITGRELGVAMDKSVFLIETNTKRDTPVDRGHLRASIHGVVQTISPLNIIGRIGPSLQDELYPQVMELGREAGSAPPPLSPILAWVRRVIRPDLDQEVRIANAVRWSIARKGIKPREYLKKGWEASQDRVKEFFVQALRNITEALSNKGGGV